jgi:hypothetical protein
MTDLQTMRAIYLMAHGGPEALVYRNDIPSQHRGDLKS